MPLSQAQLDALKTQHAALGTTINSLVADSVVIPPPNNNWPRLAPDLLDIDLLAPESVIKLQTGGQYGPFHGGAVWLDPDRTKFPGYDGSGQVFHYSDMAGAYIQAKGPACDMTLGWANWDCKFTNWGSMPPATWGVEANGMHYLECGTDGSKEPQPQQGCQTCRSINWTAQRFSVKELYWREMAYFGQDAWDNQTEIGQKLSGVGGKLVNGGTFAEIFEIGKKNLTTGGWHLQSYRYDGEGDQQADVFPNVDIQPKRWYCMEGHVKVPTTVTAVKDSTGRWIFGGTKDGVIEFKLDGKIVFSRTDVNMGATDIQGYQIQRYHGGMTRPAGSMHFRVARIALSRLGWIGPPPEVNAP